MNTHVTHQLSPDLWRFQSGAAGPQQPCNGYILRTENVLHLIDPPADLTPEVLAGLGLSQEVSHIFFTHLQSEHAEGAFHFPQARLHVPAGDEYLCQGLPAYESLIEKWAEPWEWESRGLYHGHLAGAKNERPLSRPVAISESLHPSQKIFGYEVVATPGHGKHAVTLIRRINDRLVAFCGDLICGDAKLWNWFDCDWDYGNETGQHTLAGSCLRLSACGPDLLAPAHGDIITNPKQALIALHLKITAVLSAKQQHAPEAINFPDPEETIPGWRQLSPHLYQWKSGNTLVLISAKRTALVIDDGLCIWERLPLRIKRHDAIFQEIKEALGIKKIDWIIPTHYHGDHTEFIPRLARQENARVLCLDSVAGPMEEPENYNLACPLPWYGTHSEKLVIDERVPEGYVLDWNEYSLQLFHLGGQTWYHLGIDAVIDGQRTLFVGDSIWGTDKAPAPVLCWNEADPTTRGWVFALDRMIERNPEFLVCGHGSALAAPMPLLIDARAAWTTRLRHFAELNPHASTEAFFSPFSDQQTPQ